MRAGCSGKVSSPSVVRRYASLSAELDEAQSIPVGQGRQSTERAFQDCNSRVRDELEPPKDASKAVRLPPRCSVSAYEKNSLISCISVSESSYRKSYCVGCRNRKSEGSPSAPACRSDLSCRG
jgi:hypothetical protein